MAAMKARETVRLQALRNIKKYFIEAKTAPGSNGELSDEAAMKILSKLAKQGRPDLAENEMAEVKVIETYLPQPLTEEELTTAIQHIIAELGATSPKDMGRVMGAASKALAGKADGRAISTKVKELLNK